MSDHEPPLTAEQVLLMRYVDDALTAAERAAFERRLADDPELAAEAAQHKMLLDLSRGLAVLEPSEREARRFWAHFYNRNEWRVGWTLLIVGGVILGIAGFVELMILDLHWIVRAAVLSVTAGGTLLLCSTLRVKLRTSRFDRYRGVLR
jgi:anti-sigma factor RsiW